MTGTRQDLPAISESAAIANATVRLLAEYTGRGPTKARTYIHEDFIAVVVQDALTKGEHSLVRDGKSDLVLSTRKAYQQTMRQELVTAVEDITGRTVHAFLSDNHADPDVGVECFVLSPREDGAAAA